MLSVAIASLASFFFSLLGLGLLLRANLLGIDAELKLRLWQQSKYQHVYQEPTPLDEAELLIQQKKKLILYFVLMETMSLACLFYFISNLNNLGQL